MTRFSPFHSAPDIKDQAFAITALTTANICLPCPSVVSAFSGSVFPVIRDTNRRGKTGTIGKTKIMYDDNVVPKWALFWSHSIPQTHHPVGWTLAHVWSTPKDPNGFTHLANLALVPECFASLTDKNGPFAGALRHHAFTRYGWSPDGTRPPSEVWYDKLEWNYLSPSTTPQVDIMARLKALRNVRAKALLGIIEGWW